MKSSSQSYACLLCLREFSHSNGTVVPLWAGCAIVDLLYATLCSPQLSRKAWPGKFAAHFIVTRTSSRLTVVHHRPISNIRRCPHCRYRPRQA